MTLQKNPRCEKIRVIFIVNTLQDAAVLEQHLHQAGYETESEIVLNEDHLRAALNEDWHMILSEYSLSGFTGKNSLEILLESEKDIPLIFVSGSMSEEMGVEAMRAGATDYILKDNLHRLVPAIERELRDARVRREHQNIQLTLEAKDDLNRILIETVTDYIFQGKVTPEKKVVDFSLSREFQIMSDLLDESLVDFDRIYSSIHSDDRTKFQNAFNNILEQITSEFDYRLVTKTGEIKWLHTIMRPYQLSADGGVRFIGAMQDISEQRKSELDREIILTQLKAANDEQTSWTLYSIL